MLLDVVACCCAKFETGQTFSPVQTNATLVVNKSQHCLELLRPFARSLKCDCNYCFFVFLLEQSVRVSRSRVRENWFV